VISGHTHYEIIAQPGPLKRTVAVTLMVVQGATKIVKVIIEHPNYMAGEEIIKRRTTENDPFFRTEEKSQFSPDVTPLILAAQYNNHEIVQMFLSRNHTIERPHIISCQCADCVAKQNYDSLKRSTAYCLSFSFENNPFCPEFQNWDNDKKIWFDARPAGRTLECLLCMASTFNLSVALLANNVHF